MRTMKIIFNENIYKVSDLIIAFFKFKIKIGVTKYISLHNYFNNIFFIVKNKFNTQNVIKQH
jgi:hypothetical protein